MFGIFGTMKLSGKGWSDSVRALTRGASVVLAGLGLFALSACGTTETNAPPRPQASQVIVEPQPQVQEIPRWGDRPEYLHPVHMEGRTPIRVALLLPLSHTSPQARAIAQSMRNAAEMAIFRSGRTDLLLMTKDTRGTVPGAQEAAQEAITEGAEIILGPLFAANVEAITSLAQSRHVPVVAFSSDSQVADENVYVLGFTPEQEVQRVASYAMSQGHFDFAAMVPYGDYGSRVDYTFQNTISQYGGLVVQTVHYDQGADDFRDQARALAHTYGVTRMARVDEETGQALGAEMLVPEDPGFTAVLLPEGGTTLRVLAPALPYNDIDNRNVRFLGTGLWDDERLWREPALNHGWFAAPDPELRARFGAAYQSVYGQAPHRLASLAYDAVTLAAFLADAPAGQRYTEPRLTNPSGFAGVDGIFRFNADGSTERGLAVLEVDSGEVNVVSEAPTRFSAVRQEIVPYVRPQPEMTDDAYTGDDAYVPDETM